MPVWVRPVPQVSRTLGYNCVTPPPGMERRTLASNVKNGSHGSIRTRSLDDQLTSRALHSVATILLVLTWNTANSPECKGNSSSGMVSPLTSPYIGPHQVLREEWEDFLSAAAFLVTDSDNAQTGVPYAWWSWLRFQLLTVKTYITCHSGSASVQWASSFSWVTTRHGHILRLPLRFCDEVIGEMMM